MYSIKRLLCLKSCKILKKYWLKTKMPDFHQAESKCFIKIQQTVYEEMCLQIMWTHRQTGRFLYTPLQQTLFVVNIINFFLF